MIPGSDAGLVLCRIGASSLSLFSSKVSAGFRLHSGFGIWVIRNVARWKDGA